MHDSFRPESEWQRLIDDSASRIALREDSTVLVGVSGGADSVALLCALRSLSKQWGFHLRAAHVNHGLRPEAAGEQQFVQELCASLEIPCYVRQLSGAESPKGGSAEAFWRKLRYEKFAEIMQQKACDLLALGHNADDLAETFLFHLVRGTGVQGLVFSFQSVTSGMRIIRPLWKTRRSEIEDALRRSGQQWIQDPSNANMRHSRNLIRHQVLPLFQQLNPDAVGAIVRASEAIAADSQLIDIQCGTDVSEQGGSKENAVAPACLIISDAEILEPVDSLLRSRLLQFLRSKFQSVSSRQIEQAVTMIGSKKHGTVGLTGKTLVITRHLVWLSNIVQPSDRDLAVEHARCFGGFYADLGEEGVSAEAGCFGKIRGLDGAMWKVQAPGAPRELVLANRAAGDKVGQRPLKKLLNELHEPWYLRGWFVFLVHSQSRNVAAFVGARPDLQRVVARNSRVPHIVVSAEKV